MARKPKQRGKHLAQGGRKKKPQRFGTQSVPNHPRQKKTLASLLRKLFGTAKPPRTAQQSIPYKTMHKDGICRVTDRLYSKTLAFGDINYQLAQNEVQAQILEAYCDVLNYFDSTIYVQLSFINQFGYMQDFERSIRIPGRADTLAFASNEYSDMLKNQLSKGNNGIIKLKYLTFGIEADSLKAAKPRLERIELDIISNF